MSIEQVDARDWRTTESVDFLYADIWDLRLEGDGFEPPVPQQIRSRFRESSHFSYDGLTVSRPGTGSSNPSPSTGESDANLTSSGHAHTQTGVFKRELCLGGAGSDTVNIDLIAL